MRNLHNRKRILSEVVSLEAWQQATNLASQLSLHADVVFKEGRIGGEPNSKVRFRLSVKRAELIIIIPENEPISVVRNSVSRDTVKVSGSRTAREIRGYSSSLDSSARTKINTLGASATIEAGFLVAKKSNGEEIVERHQSFSSISVEQSTTQEGNYRWELSAALNDILVGRPWDAVERPRLVLIDQRKDATKGIPPIVNIKIRCLREDLSISDIVVKEGRWSNAMASVGMTNKYIAAEAYIRTMLASEGLESGDISDPFCSVNLAYVTVDQSGA